MPPELKLEKLWFIGKPDPKTWPNRPDYLMQHGEKTASAVCTLYAFSDYGEFLLAAGSRGVALYDVKTQ